MSQPNLLHRVLNKFRGGRAADTSAGNTAPGGVEPAPHPGTGTTRVGTRGFRRGTRHSPESMTVGIFGKHRRSPEHIVDLGGSVELTELKDLLYDHGIRVAVDQNVWKDLEGEDFLAFNHAMVAWRDDVVLVARVAATRDDARRTDFPMIVAAAQRGAELCDVPSIFELVRMTFHDTARARSLEHLHEIVAAHRAQALQSPPAMERFADDVPALGELIGRPSLGPNDMGLTKVLYSLERQMGSWTAPARSSRIGPLSSVHVRVPGVATWPVESAALWARFFHEQTTGQRAPVFALTDAAGRFVDVFVGDPPPSLLRCLHASPTAMPDVTQIPYELDEFFLTAARGRLAKASAEAAAVRARRPATHSTSDATHSMPSTLQSPGDETGGAETAAPAPERVVSQTRHPLESSHDTSKFKDPASAGTALDPPEADPVARDDRDDRPDSPGNIPQAAAATLTVAAAATTIAPSPRITAVVAEPQERIAESEELVAEPEAAVPPPLPRPPTPRPRRQVLMRRWPIIVAGSVVAALTILVFVLLIWAQHTSAPSDAPPRSPATQR